MRPAKLTAKPVLADDRRKRGDMAVIRRGEAGAFPPAPALQLATLVAEAPQGDDWLHEMKYDGYRCALAIAGGKVRCYTRNGLDWTDRFARIAAAAAIIDAKAALIDGEVVAFAGGRTDFGTLQNALKSGGDLGFFAFDLLELDGKDLRGLPLIERKTKLEALLSSLPKTSPIHYSAHVRGSGGAVMKKICAEGLEGIVSKRAEARYVGRRNGDWLKTKCTRRQEFIIIGWSPSSTRGRPFASLLLGVNQGGVLVYSGRVGTGFDGDMLDLLAAKMAPLERKTPPAEGVPADARRGAHWVEPKLVAEIAFTEVTSDGALRHPSFQGLREDKEPSQVVREIEAETPSGTARDTVAGVRLSSPDKVLFPKQGLTKSDLATYYEAAAERMLAQSADRPLSLVRCPQGRASKCFFQKHDTGGFPDAIRSILITEGSGAVESYYYLDSLPSIIAGVQMGVLEFHIWGCKRDRLEQPDRLVFDLDPDEALTFADVREAATDVRDRLEALGLKSWPMLTGGKGIHVVVPLARRGGWDELKIFARGFARTLSEEEPARFLAKASKASRKGRIFIDWMRNDRGSTAIAPYSTRAREGAPVAMPVRWAELGGIKAANIFTLSNAAARLREPDPWADMGKPTQSLTKTLVGTFG